MKVTFWGTRGSLPVSGRSFVEFGGDTPCLRIEVESSRDVVVLDAGTGIRELGQELLAQRGAHSNRVHLFLTHAHWDHIQGFPFFGPAFSPEYRLDVYCTKDAREFLTGLMSPPYFPVGLDAMQADKHFHRLEAGGKVTIGDAMISWIPLPHPQESTAFRIDGGGDGGALVFATDTEHPPSGLDERLVEFARGAGALVYDAQYTPDEYPAKKGWGHSTWRQAVATAVAAGVERLILFSHDPAHDDEDCRRIEAEAREQFPATISAREGLVIEL